MPVRRHRLCPAGHSPSRHNHYHSWRDTLPSLRSALRCYFWRNKVQVVHVQLPGHTFNDKAVPSLHLLGRRRVCRRGRKTRHPGISCNTMLELPYASGRGTDSSAAYEFFHNVGKYPDGTRPRLGFCASCADMKLADIYPLSPAKVVRTSRKVPAAQTGEPTAEPAGL